MIGENIRSSKKESGVSQKELAERLQVHQKDISRWRMGRNITNGRNADKNLQRA